MINNDQDDADDEDDVFTFADIKKSRTFLILMKGKLQSLFQNFSSSKLFLSLDSENI